MHREADVSCRLNLALLAFAMLSGTASADDRVIGSWTLRSPGLSVTDKLNVYVFAEKIPDGIAVRCIDGELSVSIGRYMLGPGPFREGTRYPVAVRIKGQPSENFSAGPIDDKSLEIIESANLARRLAKATHVAVRVSLPSSSYDFDIPLSRSAEAVGTVARACR